MTWEDILQCLVSSRVGKDKTFLIPPQHSNEDNIPQKGHISHIPGNFSNDRLLSPHIIDEQGQK